MVSEYNVVWYSPSKDCTGVMPIGNGDMGAGVYAIQNDALYLLLSKNDAFNYQGDLYKTGRVRVDISPNPFSGGCFTQTLDIEKGCIRIRTQNTDICIWADANFNVFHVEVKADFPIQLSVTPEFWNRLDGTKDVCQQDGDQILWYFNVGDRSSYREELAEFGMEHLGDRYPDPYRYTVFGNLLECDECTAAGQSLTGNGDSFDIRIYGLCMQTPRVYEWIHQIKAMAQEDKGREHTWRTHLRWWSAFWERSHICISDSSVPTEEKTQPNIRLNSYGIIEAKDNGALVAQGYAVYRFLTACQSRGSNQMKFNGGLFTQQFYTRRYQNRRKQPYMQPDGRMLLHEDDRLWGSRYTFQNQRLLYWPMLASGDFDLIFPFFRYYFKLLDIRKDLARDWFGHEGAYYRENVQPTGMDVPEEGRVHPPKTKRGQKYRGWYHDYYFTCSLELVTMMIAYVRYTEDKAFLEHVLTPTAREVILFFDKHYERDENGKLVLDPAQVLETFWIAVNPAPDIAGLHCVLNGVLELGAGTEGDKENWRRLLSELPGIPMRQFEGREVIAPAEAYAKKRNFENGELYPVFPFTSFGVGYGTEEIVKNTMAVRTCPDSFKGRCWTQDAIDWAHAGEAEKARDALIRRFRTASPHHRFPFYGRENPDSCPDFDHFGSGGIALQHMLVQETNELIYLLPAWPRNWNVHFKLCLRNNGTIEGEVRDGRLQHWEISPASWRERVVLPDEWKTK